MGGTVSRLGNIFEDVSIKAPVRAASTPDTPLPRTGLVTVDGIALAEGDRVLDKDQADQTLNGIWQASSGIWIRSNDASKNTDFVEGTQVYINSGTVNAGQIYVLTTTDDPVVIGTSDLTFVIREELTTAPAHRWVGTSLQFQNPDGSWGPLVNLVGAAGPQATGVDFIFPSLTGTAGLQASAVDVGVESALIMGYAAAGDMAPFTVMRVPSQPLYGGYRSTDRFLPNGSTDNTNGGWWIYIPGAAGIDARAFGVTADWNGVDASATDNATPLQNAINFTTLSFGTGYDTGGGGGGVLLMPQGTVMFSSKPIVQDGVCVLGAGTYGTILKPKDTFNANSDFIRLGNPGDLASVCAAQARGGAGALTLNGTNVANGAAQMLQKRQIGITSSGNDVGISFTLTGFGADGGPLSETIAGVNAGTALSAHLYLVVTGVSANGAAAGTVSVGNPVAACFGARLENAQIFTTLLNAASGVAAVYSNNAQHTGGLKKVKIFGGNRCCAKFETGIGGASYVTFEDVETFNHGNEAGVTSNNPQIYVNWAGLMFPMRNIVMGGPPTGGAAATGLWIDGGIVKLETFHVESVAVGIHDNIRNVNDGRLTLTGVQGGGGVTDLILIDNAATVTAHLYIQGVTQNGSTHTVADARPAHAGQDGDIFPWTAF